MKISRLLLKNFRNYPTRDFSFDPELTLVVGPNGAGKTNILEAMYLLATGNSWRTNDVGEMVRLGEEVGHVHGAISENSEYSEDQVVRLSDDRKIRQSGSRSSSSIPKKEELQVALTRGNVQGKRTSKLRYKIDGVPKRRAEFVGKLKVVLFEPESLEIVIGDPTHRRAFLDECLTQTNVEYARSLSVYAKALRVRNRLLDAIREGKARRETLEYWERAMVKHGEKLQMSRAQLIDWVNGNLASEGLSLQGLSFFSISYDPSVVNEERLAKYREREIAAGFSLVGPQRDDFRLRTTNHEQRTDRDLAVYGSRGEQRMAVLRLKLAEAQWIEEKTDESPVLLLDDIYSELDDEHDRMVQELIRDRQTIIAATEKPSGHYASDQVIRL